LKTGKGQPFVSSNLTASANPVSGVLAANRRIDGRSLGFVGENSSFPSGVRRFVGALAQAQGQGAPSRAEIG